MLTDGGRPCIRTNPAPRHEPGPGAEVAAARIIGFRRASTAPVEAGVAQLVEQRIRNAKVGSSTLLAGTRFNSLIFNEYRWLRRLVTDADDGRTEVRGTLLAQQQATSGND
jgi:hypothetical protein